VEHRDWLYTLFSTAAKSPTLIDQRSKVNSLELIDLDPQEAKALSTLGLDVSVKMFKDLGIYWGDQ
jgi:hypothetical protein